jgi:hypothetical protein
MLKLKEFSKFMVSLFAAVGLVKVSDLGFGMMESGEEEFYWTGLSLVVIIVLFVAVTTYVLGNKLSEK